MTATTTQKRQLLERLAGHDFCGEILDDHWCEDVAPLAAEYVHNMLDLDEHEEELDEETWNELMNIVLASFVRYLAKQYETN